jgi:hypothetical protein
MSLALRYAEARPAFAPDFPPSLAVVVDTEEEFRWDRPFSRDNRSVSSIQSQGRAQRIFDALGAVPTYLVDYCVASDPQAVALLGGLEKEGRCRIGAHLHGWVTPPFEEEVSAETSYQCNLPETLERAKMVALTQAIEASFGLRPKVFKAGRYGFGAHTATVLAELGYRVDCSFVPFTSFRPDDGPSFLGVPPAPFWLDTGRRLLEVPMTRGFLGLAASQGASLQGLFDRPWFRRCRLGGVLARTGLVERSTLTPEGVPADEQIRLLKALLASGERVFTLTYHSPSLEPGNTPYVRDAGELDEFLHRIGSVLGYFQDELGGTFTTFEDLHSQAGLASCEALRQPGLSIPDDETPGSAST